MNLFQLGDFVLSGGARSPWRLECDALTDGDWRCLAAMVRQLVGPFASVEGVPRGGVLLARALKSFAGTAGPHLIVDDVLTTGGSMERAKAAYRKSCERFSPREDDVVGAVVFARGQCPPWVRAVFQMPECFWTKPRHR